MGKSSGNHETMIKSWDIDGRIMSSDWLKGNLAGNRSLILGSNSQQQRAHQTTMKDFQMGKFHEITLKLDV